MEHYAFGHLTGRPAASRPEFQDGHAFQRDIMRAAMGQDPFHPGILDPKLLLKQGDLVITAVDLGLQPNMARQRAS